MSETERSELTALLRGDRHAARTLKRAQILLAADAGESESARLAVGGVVEPKAEFGSLGVDRFELDVESA